MTLHAITKQYRGERLDQLKNFHGNQIVYISWDRHLMFCAPVALPLSPDMPFQALLNEVIPGAFKLHPEFKDINWPAANWYLNGQSFTPELDKSLIDQGIDHKSILRFATPELTGIDGTGS